MKQNYSQEKGQRHNYQNLNNIIINKEKNNNIIKGKEIKSLSLIRKKLLLRIKGGNIIHNLELKTVSIFLT